MAGEPERHGVHLHDPRRGHLLGRHSPDLDQSDKSIGDRKLEQLLEAVAAQPDPAKRIAADGAVQDYLAQQAYVIPLFEEPQVYGAQAHVRDFGFEAVARPSFYSVWLDR